MLVWIYQLFAVLLSHTNFSNWGTNSSTLSPQSENNEVPW